MTIDFNELNINTLNPESPFDVQVLDFLKSWLSKSDSLEVQTSGSTGVPKKLLVQKNKMVDSAKMTCSFLGLSQRNSALLCLPVEYISGMMMVVRAAEAGMILKTTVPDSVPLEHISEQFDFCAMTPLQVENSIEKLHLIKNLIIGGAAVSTALKAKIKTHLDLHGPGNRIYETYGMTETLSHIAMKNIYPDEENFFRILPDVQIETDERGCLRIYAPKVNDAWLQTSDVVEITDGGSFRFLGRADHVINSGGAKIHPEEIEEKLKKVVDRELMVFGKKDDILGEQLTLMIEGEENAQILAEIEAVQFDKKFHRPKEIIFVPKIPRTPNGKISRIEAKKLSSL